MPFNNLDTFGTVVNCIDGRAQQPASDWIKLHCNVKFVDAITTPGAECALSGSDRDRAFRIQKKVKLSVERHMSSVVAVVGHHDCAANPCTAAECTEQIRRAVRTVTGWKLGTRIVGLYVNEWNSCDVVYDSDEEFPPMRSYL